MLLQSIKSNRALLLLMTIKFLKGRWYWLVNYKKKKGVTLNRNIPSSYYTWGIIYVRRYYVIINTIFYGGRVPKVSYFTCSRRIPCLVLVIQFQDLKDTFKIVLIQSQIILFCLDPFNWMFYHFTHVVYPQFWRYHTFFFDTITLAILFLLNFT